MAFRPCANGGYEQNLLGSHQVNKELEEEPSKPRLLALSAEIRNRIYEYALGGRGIFVKRPKLRAGQAAPPVIFSINTTDAEIWPRVCLDKKAYGGLSCRLFDRPPRLRRLRISDDYSDFSTKKNLGCGLLRTCRQIYEEAALIPFVFNEFTIRTFNDALPEFTALLSNRQLAIITHLTLLIKGPDLPSLPMSAIQRLPSLRRLSILLSKVKTSDDVLQTLMVFGQGPATLVSVEIELRICKWGRRDDFERVVPIAEDLKKALLGEETDSDEGQVMDDA